MSIRVLWLAKGLGRGGAERLLVGMARRLDRDRFDVEVAYLLPWKDALVPELAELGVRAHCLGSGSPVDPRWAWRLRTLVGESGVDLVHTHAPYPAIGARLVVGNRVPIVHTEHNTWDRYRPATRWANVATYRRSSAVIAVSQAVADSIRPVPARGRKAPAIRVVTHGHDLDTTTQAPRAEARARLGLDPRVPVVGTVGNLTPKKDHAALLAAHAAVVRERPDAKLVVVGTGPQEQHLHRVTRSLGLEHAVVFTGSRGDVPQILPAFDVFALSSRHEGLPIALLEAMASGVAVVATRVGGVPEVVDDGVDGLLVHPNDPGSLGAALGKLLDDDTVRRELGARAIETARRFDLGVAVQQIEDVYDQALASR